MNARARRSLAATAIAALVSIAPVAVAEGKKVSVSAPGGPIPNASGNIPVTPLVLGELVQTYTLKGSKVKKKQILDVNLILNGTGSAPNAAAQVIYILSAPSGEFTTVGSFGAQSISELKIDDQSELILCNPFFTVSDDCNYVVGAMASGGTGTATGSVHGTLTQQFKGLNPKGTWRLRALDLATSPETMVLGETTLEVKVGKRFAKED
jgi:hypothetical protein